MTLVKDIIKDNWYLFLLLVGIIGLAVVFQMRDTSTGGTVGENEAVAQASVAANAPMWTPERPSEQQRVRKVIAEHKHKLEADPQSSGAPMLLAAMGNLHRHKLGDNTAAVQCYERLLHDYPNWEGKRTAYIQLVGCYKDLEDRDSLRRIYREMMEYFPPESQEYQYAQQELAH